MTLEEAIALQPAWIGLWLNWLLVGAFVLPLVLLVWRETRLAGLVVEVASVVSGFGVNWLYDQMGYVKLLGLPHVLLWTPAVIYLWAVQKRPEVRVWPRRVIWVIGATILVSLAFDYVDVIRYLLGERTPAAMPA